MFSESSKKRRPLEIIGAVVIFILAAAIVCTFVLYGIFKDSNTAPSFFGKRVYIMNGDGMEPRIKKGSAVFIDEGVMPETVGNVILCNIDGKLAVVGYVRNQSVTLSDGTVETKYIVKYDNTPADQQWAVDREDIIGKAVSYDVFLGGLIRFASSKTGMLLIVILPCALLVVYEVIMLIVSLKKRNAEASEDAGFKEPDMFALKFGENNGGVDAPDIKFDLDESLASGLESSEPSEPESTHDIMAREAVKIQSTRIYTEELQVRKAVPVEEIKDDVKKYDSAIAESKTEEAAKPLPADETNINMSARIDELIKLLEAEKSRLSDK